jgi:hypothetical protein
MLGWPPAGVLRCVMNGSLAIKLVLLYLVIITQMIIGKFRVLQNTFYPASCVMVLGRKEVKY